MKTNKTGRPRAKSSITIVVSHPDVPKWVTAAARAGLTPPQYVASVLQDAHAELSLVRDSAYLHGYRSAIRELREVMDTKDAEAEVSQDVGPLRK